VLHVEAPDHLAGRVCALRVDLKQEVAGAVALIVGVLIYNRQHHNVQGNLEFLHLHPSIHHIVREPTPNTGFSRGELIRLTAEEDSELTPLWPLIGICPFTLKLPPHTTAVQDREDCHVRFLTQGN